MKAIVHLAKVLPLSALTLALWGSQAEAKVDRVSVTAEVAQLDTKAATLAAAKREARRRAVEQGAAEERMKRDQAFNSELAGVKDELVRQLSNARAEVKRLASTLEEERRKGADAGSAAYSKGACGSPCSPPA